MSALTPTVMPILAMPFGIVPLPGAATRNAALASLLTARAAVEAAARPGRNPLCHESGDDLTAWSEPAIRELVGEMRAGVTEVVRSVNTLDAAALESIRLEARGWFTIVRPDGAVSARTHSLTSWCAIYCVTAPGPSASRRDSGLLRLYESRLGTMFSDATNATMKLPYTPGHFGWRPTPGEMAVFPAWITHEIAMLRSPGELILVSLRCRFIAPGQQGWSTW